MTAQTKKNINKYLDAIGGIGSIQKEKRMIFLKATIKMYSELDSMGIRVLFTAHPYPLLTKEAIKKLNSEIELNPNGTTTYGKNF